jgi:hypothetical protein
MTAVTVANAVATAWLHWRLAKIKEEVRELQQEFAEVKEYLAAFKAFKVEFYVFAGLAIKEDWKAASLQLKKMRHALVIEVRAPSCAARR